MHYKTIVLELMKQYTEIHDQLRRSRALLPTLELYAGQLRSRHEIWQEHLSQTRPGSDPRQTANEALEIALQELKDFLRSSCPTKEDEHLSLEEAMAFIRRRIPHD